MNKMKIGRPVDISGINVDDIELWMNSEKLARKAVICQAIISLNNGVSMKEVCNVLGVTRESVRLWKEQFRKDGLDGFLKEKKVGKRSKLNEARKMELKNIVRLSPKKQAYKQKNWTGVLIQDYVLSKWGLNVSLRTAQLWLSKIR
jgi:transposase